MTEFPGRNFSLASVKSGWLRGLGHFARASLPLPDPWRRPSERTTDCRMALIWPEHHWQSCQPVAGATVLVCQTERRTLSLSNLTIRLFNLTATVFVNRIFDRFYLEFDFWQTLRCILQKLHTIVWNIYGYPYVKLYLIRWSFTRGIAKSLGGSLFFWTQSIVTMAVSVAVCETFSVKERCHVWPWKQG